MSYIISENLLNEEFKKLQNRNIELLRLRDTKVISAGETAELNKNAKRLKEIRTILSREDLAKRKELNQKKEEKIKEEKAIEIANKEKEEQRKKESLFLSKQKYYNKVESLNSIKEKKRAILHEIVFVLTNKDQIKNKLQEIISLNKEMQKLPAKQTDLYSNEQEYISNVYCFWLEQEKITAEQYKKYKIMDDPKNVIIIKNGIYYYKAPQSSRKIKLALEVNLSIREKKALEEKQAIIKERIQALKDMDVREDYGYSEKIERALSVRNYFVGKK